MAVAKDKVLTKPMSFSIRTDVLDALTSYCKERGCSRSWFMTKALEHYLVECLEDKEDYELAAAAWNEFLKSGKKGYSAEEVFAKAGCFSQRKNADFPTKRKSLKIALRAR